MVDTGLPIIVGLQELSPEEKHSIGYKMEVEKRMAAVFPIGKWNLRLWDAYLALEKSRDEWRAIARGLQSEPTDQEDRE